MSGSIWASPKGVEVKRDNAHVQEKRTPSFIFTQNIFFSSEEYCLNEAWIINGIRPLADPLMDSN